MTYRPEHDAKPLTNIFKLPSQAAAVAGCRRWSDEINVKFLQLYQELEMLDEYAFEFVLGTVKGLTAAKLMAALRNKEEKA